MRLYIFGTGYIIKRFSKKEVRSWGSGTQKMLNNPSGLLLPCVIGPRWNCHAMFANLGPFKVQHSIKIDVSHLATAESWTAVIYDNKFRTIANSSESNIGNEIQVGPGYYSVILRYYSQETDVNTPAVYVDSELLAESTKIKDEKTQYTQLLNSIKGRKTIFYFLLHYYVFYLLKNCNRFSKTLIRSEFLPAGNPETTFLYGYIAKGKVLKLNCESGLFENALVFISVYNEASFPQAWTQVDNIDFTLGGINESGAYLVRVVPKTGQVLDEAQVKTLVQVSCA